MEDLVLLLRHRYPGLTTWSLTNRTELDFSNTEVEEIPIGLWQLEKIKCHNCPKLKKIECLSKLQKIDCFNCPLLKKIPGTRDPRHPFAPECHGAYVNLKGLYLVDCPLITEIPNGLEELEVLHCSRTGVTALPNNLFNLKVLDISGTNVATIPRDMKRLVSLKCEWCPNLVSIPENLIKLKTILCKFSPRLYIPFETLVRLDWCEGNSCEHQEDRIKISIHPQIGKDTEYNNGAAIGDPSAPYQIPMPKQFVQNTQYKKLPLNDEVLQIHLQTEPKPHVVFACPVGHLHSRADCGVPTELRVCEVDNCPFIVGGTHHFLAPGNYVVYHDGYDHANVWYGNFPVFDYPAYELLVEQYNLAADKVDLPRIVPVAERGFTNIARLSDIPVAEGTECPMCGDELQVGKTYVLPDCGHPICDGCLTMFRGGNLANINVGTAEDFQRRRCGICERRFRFGGGLKKYKLYNDTSCSIQ
jgi:hypothetical protein